MALERRAAASSTVGSVADCFADMVAMATHGRKGLSRAILGSAADKVLRGIHRPLLLYRSATADD